MEGDNRLSSVVVIEEVDPDDDDDEEEEDDDDEDRNEIHGEEKGASVEDDMKVIASASSSTSSSSIRGPRRRSNKYHQGWMMRLIVHLGGCAAYLYPLCTTVPDFYGPTGPHKLSSRRPQAVLDELHIMSADHHDINGPATLYDIFTHDYWGRPMNFPNSHKSWRPLTVLSFRFWATTLTHSKEADDSKSTSSSSSSRRWADFGSFFFSPLNIHRFINVLTHAAVAELVGILAVKLCAPQTTVSSFSPPHSSAEQEESYAAFTNLLRILAKILWVLHPTHVEVTANAANRPHLLAVLCSVGSCDPDISLAWLTLLLLAGYLSCETFLFQVVPAAVTSWAIVYRRMVHHHHQQQQQQQPQQIGHRENLSKQVSSASLWWTSIRYMTWRWIWFGGSGLLYYFGRYYMDTLSIPDGLIRPAENPFYDLRGWHRVRNYLYILSIHVAKAWDLDFIGFSHEYGRACLEPIESWNDTRLFIPLIMAGLYLLIGLYFVVRPSSRQPIWSLPLILYVVHLAWMTSLFPVAGVVKVGTFIADRIVVASTVSTTLMVAYLLTCWIQLSPWPSVTNARPPPPTEEEEEDEDDGQKASSVTSRLGARTHHHPSSPERLAVVMLLGALAWRRIHVRSTQWMDSKPLLESSLITCPRFAKGHLEISKIYSGLYPHLFNLTQSRWHLEQAEAIDPDYCDVHQQFAHVAVQEHRYLEFEERLTKALLCPFTMAGSTGLWQRYWKLALDPTSNSPAMIQASQVRYERYMATIQRAIQAEEAKGEQVRSASPLVQWHKEQ